MYLKPAAALLALVYADPIQLSHAERARQESLGRHDDEAMAKLVLNASFHRAMMKGMRTDDDGKKKKKRAIAALLQDRKRRRAAGRHTPLPARSVLSGGVNPPEEEECDPLEEEEDPDVGVLSYAGCSEDHTCVESTSSSLGGICVASDHVGAQVGRLLQDGDGDVQTCPAGCPADVCACFDVDVFDEVCFAAVVDSCQDGSFLSACYGGTDALSQAYAETFCTLYECFDEKGLDPVDGNPCNDSDECYEALYDCYCDYYEVVCAKCESGVLPADLCEYDDSEVCQVSECCAQFGSVCFQGGGLGPTIEPTSEPTDAPNAAPTTPAPAEPTPAPEEGMPAPDTPPPAEPETPPPSAATTLAARHVLMVSIGCVLAPLLLFQRGF